MGGMLPPSSPAPHGTPSMAHPSPALSHQRVRAPSASGRPGSSAGPGAQAAMLPPQGMAQRPVMIPGADGQPQAAHFGASVMQSPNLASPANPFGAAPMQRPEDFAAAMHARRLSTASSTAEGGMAPGMNPAKAAAQAAAQAAAAALAPQRQGRQGQAGYENLTNIDPMLAPAAPAGSQAAPMAGGVFGPYGPAAAGAGVHRRKNSQTVGQPLPAPVHGGPLPPKSANDVAITPLNTRVTPLPPSTANVEDAKRAYEPLTEFDTAQLRNVMRKDVEYQAILKVQQERSGTELRKRADEMKRKRRKASGSGAAPGAVGLGRLQWWEMADDEDPMNTIAYEPFKVVLPAEKRAEYEKGQRGPRGSVSLSKVEMKNISMLHEDLVPIRLEIDHEHWKLRDTFTWNATDSNVGVELFAQTICEDFGLPTFAFVPAIKEAIQTQVSDHIATEALRPKGVQNALGALATGPEAEGTPTKGELDEEKEKWWSTWRTGVYETVAAEIASNRKRGIKRSAAAVQAADAENAPKASGMVAADESNADVSSPKVIDLDALNGAAGDEKMAGLVSVPSEELRIMIKVSRVPLCVLFGEDPRLMACSPFVLVRWRPTARYHCREHEPGGPIRVGRKRSTQLSRAIRRSLCSRPRSPWRVPHRDRPFDPRTSKRLREITRFGRSSVRRYARGR